MLSSFRRLSKSTVGTIIMVAFLLLILASFAMGDLVNLGGGKSGLSSSTLVKVGGEEVTDRDMSEALQQRLEQVRREQPDADYAALAQDFEPLLTQLIDNAALSSLAKKYGFNLSKKLVDAQIAQIPAARGLDGKFSDQAYAAWLGQQRMTDEQLRRLIRAGMLQQLLLQPLAASPRMPIGAAGPYASMLLEVRQGDLALVPIAAFRAGLTPTDADLQRFYAANRARYMVPEQRSLRIARLGAEQVSGIGPSDQEIAAYYAAHPDLYGSSDSRVISQAVVPDEKSAQAIATRARAGGTFAAAAAPAGFSAADVSIGPQKRQEYAGLAGTAVAAAAWSAQAGQIVGPIHSDLGWHVVKVESVKVEPGKPLSAVKAEIAALLSRDKRKEAIETLVEKVQSALDDGASFEEAAAAGKLSISQTPLLFANGTSRQNAAFRLAPELSGALKSGFELEPNEDPVVESLPSDVGYLMVAPAQVVAAAPAPLAEVKTRVGAEWIDQQAAARARAVAVAIAAKVAKGVPVAHAVAQVGAPLPAPRPLVLRRIDITTSREPVPEPVRMLFSLIEGKSRMVADPRASALAIVKLNKIVPGNAILQPGLIAQVQRDFSQPMAQEYAAQFVAAARAKLGVKRNEAAISAIRKRIIGG